MTAALCERWQPGVTLLPMTDERCETHVVVDLDGARQAIHFQEWWIKHRAALPAHGFVQVGLDDAEPGAGRRRGDHSRPTSCSSRRATRSCRIGTILGRGRHPRGDRDEPAQVVGLSPIIGGAPVRGMADACLPAIGVEVSAEGVGPPLRRAQGRRPARRLADPRHRRRAIVPGVDVRAVPLLMTDDDATAQMVRGPWR